MFRTYPFYSRASFYCLHSTVTRAKIAVLLAILSIQGIFPSSFFTTKFATMKQENKASYCRPQAVVVNCKDLHQNLWICKPGKGAHSLFENFSARVFLSVKQGQILHRDDISFHLSHQPPLYVMCRDLVIRMGLFII